MWLLTQVQTWNYELWRKNELPFHFFILFLSYSLSYLDPWRDIFLFCYFFFNIIIMFLIALSCLLFFPFSFFFSGPWISFLLTNITDWYNVSFYLMTLSSYVECNTWSTRWHWDRTLEFEIMYQNEWHENLGVTFNESFFYSYFNVTLLLMLLHLSLVLVLFFPSCQTVCAFGSCQRAARKQSSHTHKHKDGRLKASFFFYLLTT